VDPEARAVAVPVQGAAHSRVVARSPEVDHTAEAGRMVEAAAPVGRVE
jgi:hypothetical protein